MVFLDPEGLRGPTDFTCFLEYLHNVTNVGHSGILKRLVHSHVVFQNFLT